MRTVNLNLEELSDAMRYIKARHDVAGKVVVDDLAMYIETHLKYRGTDSMVRSKFINAVVESSNELPRIALPEIPASFVRTVKEVRKCRSLITAMLETPLDATITDGRYARELVDEMAEVLMDVSNFFDATLDENFTVKDLAGEFSDFVADIILETDEIPEEDNDGH